MKQFNLYARYYDLLYKEKDYGAEAKYVSALIEKYNQKTKTILNLGCGTGKHDMELARLGYKMTGIDISAEMIKIASENSRKSGQVIRFDQGDIREFDLGEKFDAVISLFHVMSYQVTNEDLLNAFRTANRHLHEGGIFIFDCWYGPGVLTDPPVVRIKRMQSDNLDIIRIAEPVTHPNENVVDVNYTILFDNGDYRNSSIEECHKMRYLFVPEVKNMLDQTGFGFTDVYEWMRWNKPTRMSWNVCFIAQVMGKD